jgi:glycine dehydrogenase subunit 1
MVVGTIQPLGLHMLAGGSLGGFIATPDEERYVREYPTLLQSIAETTEPGEVGFGMTLLEQTSYDAREAAKDWTGHTVHLWAAVSAAYMSLLGPQGFRELGDLILARSHYAADRLGRIDGVSVRFGANFFKEFVLNFDESGRTVTEINRLLREHHIFGGKDLSADFATLGQSALYCVTEVHTQTDIDALVSVLTEIVEE